MSLFIFQGNESDCGFASLKMLLAHLNKDQSYLYLDKNKKGNYSFFNLMSIAKEYDVTLIAERYTSKDEVISCPSLVLIDEKHLVFVKSFKRNFYLIYDPGVGIYKLKKEDFAKRWSGLALEVKEYKKHKIKRKRDHVLPLKSQIISNFISLVSIAMLVVGFFFVKENSYVFIPIIFITGFAIGELVDNWYLIKEYNSFDRLHIDKYFKSRNNDLKSQYYDYVMFKKDYFSFGRKYYSAFAVVAVFMFVLIYNDMRNAIVILSFLLVLVVEQLLVGDNHKRRMDEISHKETQLDKDANYVDSIKEINLSANRLALRFSAIKCINMFLLLIGAFIMMLLSENLSVNFILFHFGAYYILLTNIEVVLNYSTNYKNYLKSKCRFLDIVK